MAKKGAAKKTKTSNKADGKKKNKLIEGRKTSVLYRYCTCNCICICICNVIIHACMLQWRYELFTDCRLLTANYFRGLTYLTRSSFQKTKRSA